MSKNAKPSLRSRLNGRLPLFVYFLFLSQIVLDVVSYWMDRGGLSNTLTLALRMAVLAVSVLLCFCLSRRKHVYWIAAGVMLLILAGHIWAASRVGYQDLFKDLTNFVRVVHMPILTLCLITLLRENEDCYRAMKYGILSCLYVVVAVMVLAQLTGTELHTYNDGTGLIGWFNNTNSQSSNLCILVPVSVALVWQEKGWKSPLFWITILGGFGAMYYLGTRLAFAGLAATGFGLAISMIIIRPRDWKKSLVFFCVTVVFLALIPFSPMVRHQKCYDNHINTRQAEVNKVIAEKKPEPPKPQGEMTEAEKALFNAKRIEVLTPIYEKFLPDFCEIFGTEKTIKMYNYSYNVAQLTATRPKKLQFARLLMDGDPLSSRIFGLELDRFDVNAKEPYDVENDLHGMYFLYGYVGLAAMVLFLLYFIYLIIRALITGFRRYFTLDAVGWGIGLVLALIHTYFTAGVLRRPSAAFYLAAILAAVYYLTRIKTYPDTPVKK